MTWGDIAGLVVVGGALALLAWALLRMRPLGPYLAGAAALLLCDLALRLAAPRVFPEYGTGIFVFTTNPAASEPEDLGWPNWAAAALVVALALWLAVRPARRSVAVGTGLVLVVPLGGLNLLEPALRGFTTDYLLLGDLVLNLADLALMAGLPILLLGLLHWELLSRRRERMGRGGRGGCSPSGRAPAGPGEGEEAAAAGDRGEDRPGGSPGREGGPRPPGSRHAAPVVSTRASRR